jgi:hypothetical protein
MQVKSPTHFPTNTAVITGTMKCASPVISITMATKQMDRRVDCCYYYYHHHHHHHQYYYYYYHSRSFLCIYESVCVLSIKSPIIYIIPMQPNFILPQQRWQLRQSQQRRRDLSRKFPKWWGHRIDPLDTVRRFDPPILQSSSPE